MEYVYYTSEGKTISPEDVEVENFQVLGFENEHKNKFFKENSWLFEIGFKKEEILYKEILSDELKINISKVIDYLFKDEQKHWEESGYPRNHIYNNLLAIKKYCNFK